MPNAIVRVFSAARMLAIEAQAIVGGYVSGNNLMLQRFNGSEFSAGNVRGPQGSQGIQGIQGLKGDKGDKGDQGVQGIQGTPGSALGAYPVGAIYLSVVNTSPATLFGGTWSVIGPGQVLVGVDTGQTEFNTPMKTGGVKSVALTAAQSGSPAHSHTYPDTGWTNAFSGNPIAGYYAFPMGEVFGTAQPSASSNNVAANAAEAHTNLQPFITCYMWRRTA